MNPPLWWHLKTQNNIFGCWRVEKKCFRSLVYGRQEHCTFYGCRIQTERLKLLLPQRHAFHLAEVVKQSLGAAASAGGEEEETLVVRWSQLTSSVKKSKGWIPLQVTYNQLLDAGVGWLDGLAELFKTLRGKKKSLSLIPLFKYCYALPGTVANNNLHRWMLSPWQSVGSQEELVVQGCMIAESQK